MSMIQNFDDYNHGNSDSGYALLSVMALVVLASFITVTYMQATVKDTAFKVNYAAGEQFAEISKAAHHYVQDQLAGLPPQQFLVTDMVADGYLPAGYGNSNILGQRILLYSGDFPLGSPTARPTALIFAVGGTVSTQNRPPSQRAAFAAGAFAGGLPADGGDVVPAGETVPAARNCNGSDAVIDWSAGCLSAADVTNITGGFVNGNTMTSSEFGGPTWIAAEVDIDNRALMRNANSGIPNAHRMNTAIAMAGNDVLGINIMEGNQATTNDIQISGSLTVATGLVDINGAGTVTVANDMTAGSGDIAGEIFIENRNTEPFAVTVANTLDIADGGAGLTVNDEASVTGNLSQRDAAGTMEIALENTAGPNVLFIRNAITASDNLTVTAGNTTTVAGSTGVSVGAVGVDVSTSLAAQNFVLGTATAPVGGVSRIRQSTLTMTSNNFGGLLVEGALGAEIGTGLDIPNANSCYGAGCPGGADIPFTPLIQ